MTPFDAEKLFREIKERPALYDRTLSGYANKNVREKLWMEITESLNADWEDIDTEEQTKRCKNLQDKWKHIRDNFRREVHTQKNVKSGRRSGKRRQYIYYDHLKFLIPYVNYKRNASGNYSSSAETEIELSEPKQPNIKSNNSAKNIDIPRSSKTISENSNIKTLEGEILNALKYRDIEELDEDKSFCMSLVPSLRRLKDEQKLTAKIEILNTIHRVSFPLLDTAHVPKNPPSTAAFPTFY